MIEWRMPSCHGAASCRVALAVALLSVCTGLCRVSPSCVPWNGCETGWGGTALDRVWKHVLANSKACACRVHRARRRRNTDRGGDRRGLHGGRLARLLGCPGFCDESFFPHSSGLMSGGWFTGRTVSNSPGRTKGQLEFVVSQVMRPGIYMRASIVDPPVWVESGPANLSIAAYLLKGAEC